MRKSELIGNNERMIRRGCPACWKAGHKSNRVEDLILRDYIVSAASQINAGGGSNGDNPTNLGLSDFSLVATTLDKFCVEYKSLVIDLECLAA